MPNKSSRQPARQAPPDNESEAQRINRALAEAAAEAEARQADETVPGGQYLVGDVLVNAQGELLEEQKPHPTDADADEQPPAPPMFGRDTPPTPPNPSLPPPPPDPDKPPEE